MCQGSVGVGTKAGKVGPPLAMLPGGEFIDYFRCVVDGDKNGR